jgi:hypothetical protein
MIDARLRDGRLDVTAHSFDQCAARVVYCREADRGPFVSLEWQESDSHMPTTIKGYLELDEVKALRDRLDNILVELNADGLRD